jgi:hypothetical protein
MASPYPTLGQSSITALVLMMASAAAKIKSALLTSLTQNFVTVLISDVIEGKLWYCCTDRCDQPFTSFSIAPSKISLETLG